MQSKGYFSNVWWRVPKRWHFKCNPLASLLKSSVPTLGRKGTPASHHYNSGDYINLSTFMCLKAPETQQSKRAFLSLVLCLCWARSQERRKPEIRVKLLIKKGPEWFLLHLITTSSLPLDASTILDSTADNSGEVEGGLQLGSYTHLLFKLMEKYSPSGYLFTAEHPG